MTYIAEPYATTPYAASDFDPYLPAPGTMTLSEQPEFTITMSESAS